MYLRQAWADLCVKLGAENEGEVWAQLESCYSEPHRSYHNFNHIEQCLREFKNSFCNLAEVELAIWFHDAVYDTKSFDNEERSIDLTLLAFEVMGLPNAYKYFVPPIIMETKYHDFGGPWEYDIFLDIDLSIFGAPPNDFQKYCQQIRQECAWVPDEIYNEKRIQVLKRFLDRPGIYRTENFKQKFEIQARVNLTSAIQDLS